MRGKERRDGQLISSEDLKEKYGKGNTGFFSFVYREAGDEGL